MVRRRRARAEAEPGEMPLAPMADMVFLVLVFFVGVQGLSRIERTPGLDLPHAPAGQPSAGAPTGVLTLAADGALSIGGEPCPLAELPARLRVARAAEPALRVELRAPRRTPYAVLAPILQACGEAGLSPVRLATTPLPPGEEAEP